MILPETAAAVFWYPRRMFVKWSRRDHVGGGALIAQLVESTRVNGETRPRYLAHLGTCREPLDTLRHRLWFYERCEQALDRLALAPEDRAKIDAQLAVRIPPLSDAERTLWQRERAILMATFGRPDGFALVGEWTAAHEDERRRFLDELRKAEEAAPDG
jgi:hypothetical protein